MVADALERRRRGGAVLIGTQSIRASEDLSRRLDEQGVDHQVLNAERHGEEARIVAEAGRAGRITITTNMAGRGTDIKLGEGVAAAGGLHVIALQRNESARVDRQLFGPPHILAQHDDDSIVVRSARAPPWGSSPCPWGRDCPGPST